MQRLNRGREPSVRYALGPEDPLRSREPAGAGVASRTEGVPPSHGAQRRSSRRCTPPRRTLVSCLSAPRRAGVGTSMEQIPRGSLRLGGAPHSHGTNSQTPFGGRMQRPNRGREPSVRYALGAGDNAGTAGRRRFQGTPPDPGDDAGSGGRRRGRGTPPGLGDAAGAGGRRRGLGTPPGLGDDAGSGGRRRDQAGRPGPRASCPRTARSAVPP